MKILGIETSCDETAAAVVEGELNSKKRLKDLSSVLASSAEMQIKYGGILPEQAARQQVLAMLPVLKECFEKAGIKDGREIDGIAITVGPGLVGSLLVGVETAKTLAWIWDKPIIPVNHLVAHLYANFLENKEDGRREVPQFPAIGLVVSGGHTEMILLKSHEKIELVGRTRDDAAGECFDKTARILGLPYPGGPEIARLADDYFKSNPSSSGKSKDQKLDLFPRPLVNQDNFDWSFSGLKTSVLYKVREMKEDQQELNQERLAAEIQEAICDCLVFKLKKAISTFEPKSVFVAGGVAANKRLGERLAELSREASWTLFVPPPRLCTDNGSYIAACAFYHFLPTSWQKVGVNPGMTILE